MKSNVGVPISEAKAKARMSTRTSLRDLERHLDEVDVSACMGGLSGGWLKDAIVWIEENISDPVKGIQRELAKIANAATKVPETTIETAGNLAETVVNTAGDVVKEVIDIPVDVISALFGSSNSGCCRCNH